MQGASPLPTNGTFSAGAGKITSSGNILTINQSTLRAIIDWSNFSIGAGSTVSFKNGSGATLNRVTGSAGSTILGQLLATGSVYLINPQGVLIGHGATVHTGGDFVVSTLNISNSAFINGGSLLFTGDSKTAVVNLGEVSSSGGSVFLIGNSVQNGGSISAANGTAALAAGAKVVVMDGTNGQRVSVQAPGGDVTNSGFISAAQAELKSNGGNIYALAGNSGGQINATGTAIQDGHVWLIATNGTTSVSGSISAKNADGAGGTIETSGANVITAGAEIKTGKGGNWLLDPDDLTIDSTLAGTIDNTLNGGTNVTEQTTASGTGGSGDITVASNLAWTGGASLTLSAYRNIGVNNGVTISNNGSGNLTLRADNASTGTGNITFAGTGAIDFSASTGNVALLYNPPGGFASPTVYTSNVLTNTFWLPPADGSVTSQLTAYMLLNTAVDVQSIGASAATLSGTYALGRDIDLSGSNFLPLALGSPFFTGILDGRGHTLSGLTENDTTGSNLGLFAVIGTTGNVRNMNMTGVSLTETGSNYTTFGGLAGVNNGAISNVSVAGTITAATNINDVGGLVGGNFGTIQNSNSSVYLNAASAISGAYIGGLVGENGGTSISNSYASGVVYAPNTTGANIGGFAGYNYAPLSSSYATGAVTGGTAAFTGGLIGGNYTTISGTYATGTVTSGLSSQTGGLIGQNSGGSISSSHASGNVTGSSDYAGGLVGFNESGSTIVNAYATGNVTNSGAFVGGLVGRTDSTISGSYATGAVSGTKLQTDVGGLAGVSSAAISSSYATGSVTSTSTQASLGGLVGNAVAGGTITGSQASGAINGADSGNVGGLVGQSAAAITTSSATGNVTATDSANVGGLVGWTHVNGTVTQSFAFGSVTGGQFSEVGGLIGESQDTVTTSYALGSVTGSTNGSDVGGLVGETLGTLVDTYAQGSVSGGADTGGLVGKVTETGSVTTSYSSGLVSSGGPSVGAFAGLNNGSVTTGFYDSQVNSEFPAIATGSGTVTGLTTSQFQSGNMPTGLNANSVWTAPANVYPYFGWQGVPVTISGTAYNGSAVIASAGVGILSGGLVLAKPVTNGAGAYTVVEPANMVNSAGVLTYLTSLGTANTFSDGANGYAGMDLHTGTVSLISGNSSALSGINAALGTTLGGNSGANFIFTLPSGLLALTPATGFTIATTAPSLTLDQPITGAGNILVTASGNLVIGSGAGLTASSGNNITLASGGTFTNNAGANALGVTGGGQWSVYSQNPANDSTGGLTPAFIQYNATYGVTSSAQSGNGLLYALAPTIIPTLSGSITKVYDGTTTATLPASDVAGRGAIQGDSVTVTATGAAYTSPNVNSNIGVTASGLSLTASNGGIPVYGYQLASSTATGNIGSITPATLTYVSDSATFPAGSESPTFTGSVTGFVNNESLTTATTGSAIFTSLANPSSAPGSYAINGFGLTANHGNYTFTQAAGNATALTVTAAIPTPTPTPTPSPTPTPAPSSPIFISIGSMAVLDGQKAVSFTSTFTGTPINGVDVASLLAGLSYQITPTLTGPGTYVVTASGTAPAGYYLSITPATFTVIDNSPVSIPTEGRLFAPELPSLLVTPETESEGFFLSPVNAIGQFEISFAKSFTGFNFKQTPLAQSSFFSGPNEKPATYVAGVKP